TGDRCHLQFAARTGGGFLRRRRAEGYPRGRTPRRGSSHSSVKIELWRNRKTNRRRPWMESKEHRTGAVISGRSQRGDHSGRAACGTVGRRRCQASVAVLRGTAIVHFLP